MRKNLISKIEWFFRGLRKRALGTNGLLEILLHLTCFCKLRHEGLLSEKSATQSECNMEKCKMKIMQHEKCAAK